MKVVILLLYFIIKIDYFPIFGGIYKYLFFLVLVYKYIITGFINITISFFIQTNLKNPYFLL